MPCTWSKHSTWPSKPNWCHSTWRDMGIPRTWLGSELHHVSQKGKKLEKWNISGGTWGTATKSSCPPAAGLIPSTASLGVGQTTTCTVCLNFAKVNQDVSQVWKHFFLLTRTICQERIASMTTATARTWIFPQMERIPLWADYFQNQINF